VKKTVIAYGIRGGVPIAALKLAARRRTHAVQRAKEAGLIP
jgi:hypothetical protein